MILSSALSLIVFLVSYSIARSLLPPVLSLLAQGGFVRQNFRGAELPVGAGAVIPLASLAPWLVLSALPGAAGGDWTSTITLWTGLLFGMAFLGLLDDALGNRERSGFSGHLAALFEGRPTTGSLKALFGGALALAGGIVLQGLTLWAFVSAALIALATNAVNLLDVRPGRALKGCALLSGLAVAGCLAAPGLAPGNQIVAAAAPMGASLALWRRDHQGELMLGDVGANALGVTAGLLAASSPHIWQGALLLSLIAMHLYSERRSLSDLIEAVPWLSRLDRWGR